MQIQTASSSRSHECKQEERCSRAERPRPTRTRNDMLAHETRQACVCACLGKLVLLSRPKIVVVVQVHEREDPKARKR
eukprot:scaffold14334_cov28-Tisochrysis_lutea.AAC.2